MSQLWVVGNPGVTTKQSYSSWPLAVITTGLDMRDAKYKVTSANKQPYEIEVDLRGHTNAGQVIEFMEDVVNQSAIGYVTFFTLPERRAISR